MPRNIELISKGIDASERLQRLGTAVIHWAGEEVTVDTFLAGRNSLVYDR